MHRIILLFFIIYSSFWEVLTFAQEKNIVVKNFEITAPTEVKINEAFDITVKAMSADSQKITNYEGTIYFDNLNRPPADVILPSFGDDGYTFMLSDQWEHTFSKGFTFKKPGVYEIDIYEIENGDNGVSKTVSITAVDKNATPSTNIDISLTEPVNNITVGTKTITVSGQSQATSSVNILLNSKKVASTQTGADGKFSTTIGDLIPGNNDIVAEVLDWNGAIAWTSPKITVKFGIDMPKITQLSMEQGTELLAGETANFIALGDANLKTVLLKVGEKTVVLEENKDNLGTYSWALKTSEFEGEFSPIVVAESQLGTKAEFKDLFSFRTIVAKIENIEIKTTEDKKIRFTFDLTPDVDQIKYFEIKYGTESLKYTKSVITYEKSKISEEGKYTWYIPDMEPGEYFASIVWLDKDKNATSINSGEQEFLIAMDAAPTCFVEKISGFKIKQKTETYAVLGWDLIPDAVAYQIFKRDSSGNFAMIDEIVANQYRIDIDMSLEQDVYDDFKIRGICKNGNYTGEGAFSESIAVQTGPELFVFFALFIASGVAFILVRRGYIS
jgi:hypothetical protein